MQWVRLRNPRAEPRRCSRRPSMASVGPLLFEAVFKQSLTDTGITIIDVPVDYTRSTDLFAQLHEGVFE